LRAAERRGEKNQCFAARSAAAKKSLFRGAERRGEIINVSRRGAPRRKTNNQ
jgi:hypothetical protein